MLFASIMLKPFTNVWNNAYTLLLKTLNSFLVGGLSVLQSPSRQLQTSSCRRSFHELPLSIGAVNHRATTWTSVWPIAAVASGSSPATDLKTVLSWSLNAQMPGQSLDAMICFSISPLFPIFPVKIGQEKQHRGLWVQSTFWGRVSARVDQKSLKWSAGQWWCGCVVDLRPKYCDSCLYWRVCTCFVALTGASSCRSGRSEL